MTVHLTINGRPIAAPEGSTILEAARQAGIRIPTLCHHPDLSNAGTCRMCVVSVEKARDLQAACTTPVAEGMLVDSESKKVRDARRFVLELLLSDHPNDCMKCEVNGACELQDLVYEYDVPWPGFEGTRHAYPIDPDPGPFIFIDRNKCVLCTRCVRACAEIQNRDVWHIANRGFTSKLIAGTDQFLADAHCESCGQCVAYCPTGALFDKMSLHAGRAGQLTKVRTTCAYCGVGCTFDLNVRNGKVVRVTSASDAPVNGRALCVKGRYGYDYVHHPDRLTRPLVREKWLEARQLADHLASGDWQAVADPQPRPRHNRAGDGAGRAAHDKTGWVAVDWDTALDVVARRFSAVKRESGGDAVAVLASAKCTNEENYLINKLTRQVIGTNNVDHCARL